MFGLNRYLQYYLTPMADLCLRFRKFVYINVYARWECLIQYISEVILGIKDALILNKMDEMN